MWHFVGRTPILRNPVRGRVCRFDYIVCSRFSVVFHHMQRLVRLIQAAMQCTELNSRGL